MVVEPSNAQEVPFVYSCFDTSKVSAKKGKGGSVSRQLIVHTAAYRGRKACVELADTFLQE